MYRKKIEKKKAKMMDNLKKYFYQELGDGDSDSSLEGLSCDEPEDLINLESSLRSSSVG